MGAPVKYAPANAEGLKPYHATIFEWGRERFSIVYANSASEARYKAINRMRYTTAKVRRATLEDMEALS